MIRKIFYSFYVWILIILTILFLSPFFLIIWLLTFWFDKRLYGLNKFSVFWGSLYTKLVPWWKVTVQGKEKITRDKTYIIVANHQSLEDILVLYQLGIPFRWVSKAEVFKIPVYGWFMRLKGDIKLLRTSKASIKKMIRDGEKVLRLGCNMIIFPEGTRSKTGELGNFKEGAFRLAQKTERPILPVVISGTVPDIINRFGLFHGKHKVTLKILDEIPVEKFCHWDVKELTKYTRRIFENEDAEVHNN
ncbi:MAG: lysophospholipid acyltransferase family protein [Bacteroidales bacterium]|jgi:1-acyl-sn-glycerol-3-phosphate acyltransferase|nr:lysophospholipid acyltransferase family protein [Bacteroidales bacterium]